MDRRNRRCKSASSSDFRTAPRSRRALTSCDSEPRLRYHAYRSLRPVLPSGWRNRTIALLEPGDRTSTRHVVPSGPVKERMRGYQVGVWREPSVGLLHLALRDGDDVAPALPNTAASLLRS